MPESAAAVPQDEQWLVYKQGEFCFVTGRRELAGAVVMVIDKRGFAASFARVTTSLENAMAAYDCSGVTVINLDDPAAAQEHFNAYYMECDLERELRELGVPLQLPE